MKLFLAVSIAASATTASQRVQRGSSPEGYATVSYCDLLRDPERYRGQLIRVSAIYRYGFEWSELHCPECFTDETRIWVDFDDSFAASKGVRKKLEAKGPIGRTVKVTMMGRFDTGGGYGHMAAFQFRLRVTRVERAVVILNDSPVPNALPRKVLNKGRCSSD